MKKLRPLLHKYHKFFGILLLLPLTITAITGMGMIIAEDFFHNEKLADFLLSIHTMKIFGNEKIEIVYIFIVASSLLILVFTGLLNLILSMPRKK